MILACNNRPGIFSSQGAKPLNISSDNLVRKRISPIQMNSGKAVSVHEEAEPQMVMTMASPTGRVVNNCMPIQATPANDKPIHTPLPRMAKRTMIRNAVI